MIRAATAAAVALVATHSAAAAPVLSVNATQVRARW